MGLYDEARQDLSFSSEVTDETSFTFHNRAKLYLDMGLEEEAHVEFEKAIAFNPDWAYYLRSRDFNDMEKYEEGLELINLALGYSVDASNLYERGRAYAGLNRYEEAIKDFFDAVELAPMHNLYVKALQSAITHVKPEADTEYEQGNIHLNDANYAQAIEAYTRAIAINPLGAEIYLARGNAYYGNETHDEALADYEKAVQLDPAMADALAENELYNGQSQEIGTVTITSGGSVNLRIEGNADSKVAGKANPGDTFPCVGIADSGWYEILLEDGISAFVLPKLSRLDEK